MCCLFDSLASFIENMDPLQLRLVLTNYLANDPIFFHELQSGGRLSQLLRFENAQTPSLQSYVQTMSHPSTWGGAIEIRAFCDVFNARVLVLVYETRKTIEFLPWQPNDATVTLMIGYTGNHFEPIHT